MPESLDPSRVRCRRPVCVPWDGPADGVVRGKDQQTLTPKVDLPVDKRDALEGGADGKAET